jgi:hypothetical protein
MATPRENELSWSSKRGEVRCWQHPSGTLLVTLIGHGETEALPDLIAHVKERHARSPRADLFIDAWQLDGYETGYRVALTEMLRAMPEVTRVHGLLRSTIVAMGAAVANLALGGIVKIYRRPADFEAAMERAFVAAPSRRPAAH